MLTEAELARVAAIHVYEQAATVGPWSTDAYLVVGPVAGGRPGGEVIIQCRPTRPGPGPSQGDYANARFVAAARADVPWLLTLLARETAAEERLERALEEAHGRMVALCEAGDRLAANWDFEQPDSDLVIAWRQARSVLGQEPPS
jgi:protein tyrosine phosphatase (PTP) superfamily phosphohydrolase (DUF442 family)